MNTNPTQTPGDDPDKQAAMLIAKLTVLLGELKQQITANAQATATLDKLVREEIQRKITEQIAVIDASIAARHQATGTVINKHLESITAQIDRQLTGLCFYFIVILTLLVGVGAVAIIAIFK